MHKLDIAVAGAGPAGLAVALSLHRDGHRVVVFERFEQPAPIGSGLLLQPTGQAVLAELGILSGVSALGTPIDRLLGHDAKSGRVVLDMRYAKLRGIGRGLGVHRAALFTVLHDAVRSAGIPVATGAAVSGADGGWLLIGARREGPFDLIVDALGAGSPLRANLKTPGRGRPLSYGAIWGTVPWVDEGFDRAALTQRYVGARRMIGVLPIGRQVPGGPPLAAFFWSLRTDDHPALIGAPFETWRDEVCALWPDTAPHLHHLKDFGALSLARYRHHTVGSPVGDRLVAIGDSAHCTSPQLGQGANMALLDARALTLALRNAPGAAALAEYARLRRWHVRFYQAMSLILTPMYQSESRILPIVRDLIVPIATAVPPLPQFLAGLVAGRLLDPFKALELRPANL